MTKFDVFNLVVTSITWVGTGGNIWIYRRHKREAKQRRKMLLSYDNPEVRALVARLEEIARGEP